MDHHALSRATRRDGRAGLVLQAVVLGVFVAAAGCDDSTPTRPSSDVGPSPIGTTTASVAITGDTQFHRPGETSQLTATATFSDGTTRDVTAEARWSADHVTVVSVRLGLLTSVDYGRCNVTVVYNGRSARVPVRVAPEGVFLLTGYVSELSGTLIPNANVEVSSAAGSLVTLTNAQGVYTVTAFGDTVVQVEKGGFEPQERRLRVENDSELNFRLEPTVQPGGISGRYQLTIIAAPSCSLPDEAMRRKYNVFVQESPTDVTVLILDEVASWGNQGFTGSINGNAVRFALTGDPFSEYQSVVQLDSDRDLWYEGLAEGVSEDQRIAAKLHGTITVRPHSSWIPLAECLAIDHRLEFVR
jgi:hypothetical protein